MKKAHMILFLLYFFILRPSPTVLLGNELAVKLFDGISILAVFLILVYMKKENNSIKISYKKNFLLILLLALSSVFSMVISSIYLNINSSWLDIQEIFIYIFYFFVLIVGYMGSSYISSGKITKHLAIATIITVLIAIFQYYNPFNIVELLNVVYTDEKLRGLSTGNPRVFGTLYNSNWFAVYLVFAFSILFGFYLNENISNKTKCLILLSLIVSLIGIFLSGSRTGIIILFFGIIAVLLFSFIAKPRFKLILYPLIMTSVILLLFNNLDLNTKRYEELIQIFYSNSSITNVDSFSGRITSMGHAFSYSDINPLTGIGFFKNLDINTHNSFLTIYVQQGIIGITIFILFFAIYFINFIFLLKRVSNSAVKYFYIGVTAGMITMLIAFITGQYFYSVQTMSIFFLFIGFSYGYINKSKIKEKRVNSE